jgi:hypothetical protein
MGASFDKKEFKRNLAGSGSYPPVYTVSVEIPQVQYVYFI